MIRRQCDVSFIDHLHSGNHSPQIPEAVHVVATLAITAAVLFVRAQARFAYGRGRGAHVEHQQHQ